LEKPQRFFLPEAKKKVDKNLVGSILNKPFLRMLFGAKAEFAILIMAII